MGHRNYLQLLAPLLCLLATAAGSLRAETAQHSHATLPLDELLSLYQASQDRDQPEPEGPPVAASLDRLALEARLLDHSIELTVRVAATVLEEGRWTSLPLLRRDRWTSLGDLPEINNASLAIVDGWLVLLTKRSGRYRLELPLTARASSDGRQRTARIEIGEATSSSLSLSLDASSLALLDSSGRPTETLTRYPDESSTFVVTWRRLESRPTETEQHKPAPPAEPIITRASVSSVSTLEGRRVTRALYEAALQGRHHLSCRLGQGQRLDRVILNGAPHAFAVEDGSVTIELSPIRSGGESATLELVLSERPGAYHLAGQLELALPRLSWPIHELFMTLHLPEVFTYSWLSGSMEPVAEAPRARFTETMPTPGIALAFHQHLVTDSAARLSIAYSVNLDGQYYSP